MIHRHLRTTLRFLWRQRLFTGLNILGLAIGIASSWMIYRIVDFEYSYDKDLPHKERTFRLITGAVYDEGESRYGGVSAPIYQAIREEVSGVEKAVPVFGQWIGSVEISQKVGKPILVEDQEGIVAVDESYFEMVPYTWLVGNSASSFENPNNVVLTENRAREYFPQLKIEEILGKPLVYNGEIQKTISGIVKDLEGPTEFTAQEFIYLKPEVYALGDWTNTNGSDKLYLRFFEDSNPVTVLEQINELSASKWDEFNKNRDQNLSVKKWYELLPISESHFSTHINDYNVRKASKPVIYGLIGIGGFLLLLACINYINLSTVQLPQRSKEIGVRKTLGGGRVQLISQILGETLITVLLSIILAFFLSNFAFNLLGDIIPQGTLEYSNHIGAAVFLVLLVLLATMLSGIYPAWLIAKVRPINIMRGPTIVNTGSGKLTLRKSLIVFQFTIAQVFIIGALVVGQQLKYVLQKDLGFNKEAIVLVDIPIKILWDSALQVKSFPLQEELKNIDGVQKVSLGSEPLTPEYNSGPFAYMDENSGVSTERQLNIKWVDTNYLDVYDMELVAGRNIESSEAANEYLINETAAEAFGFASPQDAIGKFINRREEESFPIVGVVKDFHIKDFYTGIEPLVMIHEKSNLGTFNIKLNSIDPAQWQKSLAEIEEKWYSFYPPETFSYKFYGEALDAIYVQERNLSKLINLTTAIAIVISCLGLFGLASLTAFQRTKEIGIRKILGANVAGIVAMLSKDFVKLVIIAILIASPFAWWAVDKWLEDFAYKVTVNWWIFGFAGLLAAGIAMLTVGFQSIKVAIRNPVDSLRNE
ncbi:ABC transporter permease [Aquiflexum gelatinilyticum]|uniref:ABC transporter permease n=1 Tax=Aquiflexum gelatinilyticum TaxID=2961943 RepID=A0A9X2PAW7_9BACT|nr:ABC transporter permease [Aquiflexum gelatinilyticum]MCR9015325.1 ABC transporter permease [Aquiflexum gelatinilyticum]